MRMILVLVAVLYSGAAVAQADRSPMGGDKGAKKTTATKATQAAMRKDKPQFTTAALQACLDIDDGTKDRLDCYDAVIPPAPKPKPAKAKGVADCRFVKEEDERLTCFNGFVESLPKPPKT